MVWVKLCGMTNPEDALEAAESGADSIGMIFAPSKRRIGVAQAKEITRALPSTIETVGVFANEEIETIERVAGEVGLSAVQLHGDESVDFARSLFRRNDERRSHIRVFKTVHVDAGIEAVARDFLADEAVDAVLLDAVVHHPDTGLTDRGGTGHAFDWYRMRDTLSSELSEARIILAGGLNPGNVAEAISVLKPWGVDVCSGVEREIGKKDPSKMRAFVSAAKAKGR